MAESTRTRGACAYCGRELTRGGMARDAALDRYCTRVLASWEGSRD